MLRWSPPLGSATATAAMKRGEVPQGWQDKPAKLRPKDRDARWTVKFSKSRPREDGGLPAMDIAIPTFGYRSRIAIDRRWGCIRRGLVTDAFRRSSSAATIRAMPSPKDFSIKQECLMPWPARRIDPSAINGQPSAQAWLPPQPSGIIVAVMAINPTKGLDMAEPTAGFAQRLRALRKQKDLAQTELGQRAGLHDTQIGRFERDASRPGGDTLKRLAGALDVTSDDLLDGAEDDAARAHLVDRELLLQFQAVERTPDADKHVVKTLRDAFLTSRQLQTEPPRLFRRLRYVRRSDRYEQDTEQVFAGSPRARGSDGG